MTASTLVCVVRQESVVREVGKWLAGRIEVEWGPTGKDGLRLLAKYRPDWAIVDFHLKDMSGRQFLLSAYRMGTRPACILVSDTRIPRAEWEGLSDLGVRGSSQLPFDFDFLDSLLAAGCPTAQPPHGTP